MTVMNRVRQSYCALHGHDNLLQFEPDRLFLKCVSCEHETPGWELSRTVAKGLRASRPQLRLVRPHFAAERRVA
jgi:hypothetical protein